MDEPLKPRKVTLAHIRQALKQHGGRVTRKELAELVGCSDRTLENYLGTWCATAAGVRHRGRGPTRTYSYQAPEEPTGYEPASPAVETLIEENERLRRAIQSAISGELTLDKLGHALPVPTGTPAQAQSPGSRTC